MIIWSGHGYLVAVIVFACSLVANLITNSVTGGESYWDTHRWTLAIAFFVAAIASWFLGRYLLGRGSRTLIDKETGEEVVQNPNHALFFIRMDLWGPILAIIGLVLLVKDLAT